MDGSSMISWSSNADCSWEEVGLNPMLWVHIDSREWMQGTTSHPTRITSSMRSKVYKHQVIVTAHTEAMVDFSYPVFCLVLAYDKNRVALFRIPVQIQKG